MMGFYAVAFVDEMRWDVDDMREFVRLRGRGLAESRVADRHRGRGKI